MGNVYDEIERQAAACEWNAHVASRRMTNVPRDYAEWCHLLTDQQLDRELHRLLEKGDDEGATIVRAEQARRGEGKDG